MSEDSSTHVNDRSTTSCYTNGAQWTPYIDTQYAILYYRLEYPHIEHHHKGIKDSPDNGYGSTNEKCKDVIHNQVDDFVEKGDNNVAWSN